MKSSFSPIGFMIGCLLFVSLSPAQWNWRSPIPQGNTLLDVQFIDSALGWSVGEYGTVLHTTTGGATWYAQEYGRTDNVLSISMTSALEGWAAGDNGVILHTTDSGDDWIEQTSGVAVGLNCITFLDAQNGWAAGDNELILHTTNGGITWSAQHSVPQPISINSLHFLSLTEGWAVGSSRRVYHTTDAGTTWLPQVVGAGSLDYLSITFVDPSLGFIVGSHGSIYRTDNGGTIWSSVGVGDTVGYNQVIMQNAFIGWIVGDAGRLLRTINGGASWSSSIIGGGVDFNGFTRAGNKVWAVGELGKILRSTNSGVAWTELDSGTRLSVNWVDFSSPSAGNAVGQTGLLLRTTDGGITWSESVSPAPAISCYGVKFTDDLHGWAVGDNGTILRTQNGTTWATQASGVSHTLFGISFGSSSTGWIVGGEYTTFTGTILHSTDAGASWSVQVASTPHILYGVSFPTASAGWAVGETGTVLHTTDGGASWNPQTSGVTTTLYWCAFLDPNTGWAVGDSGRILHTTNGGTTWTRQNSGITTSLFSLEVTSSLDAVAVGNDGTILRTFNGGASWEPQYSRTLNGLFGIAHASQSELLVCGDYGTLLNYTILASSGGAVSGMLFNDFNGNGVLDVGEPGMGGWKIKLTGAAVDSVLTSPAGPFQMTNLPFGSYTLTEELQTGWAQTLPVSSSGYSFTLSAATPSFVADFGDSSASARSFTMQAGWNLLSLPLIPPDPRTGAVYPFATSSAFTFTTSYIVEDSIHSGVGFWMKFGVPQTIWMTGAPVQSDTLVVRQGWNLIGSISDTLPISSIISSPPGIVSSGYFAYTNGYVPVFSLIPGHGCWVKTSSDGALYLPQPAGALAKGNHSSQPAAAPLSGDELLVQDQSGGTQSLYFGREIIPSDIAAHELPPLPPPGAFDARFSNGSDRALLNMTGASGSPVQIRIQSASYPIAVHWKIRENAAIAYALIDQKSGRHIADMLPGEGSCTISDPSIRTLLLHAQDRNDAHALPVEFRLEQNSPNPFNPSTRIRYQLPAESFVSLKVFNLLGQEVASLAEGVQTAGTRDVQWNPGTLSGGVYFARLRVLSTDAAREYYTQTRKMLYIK